MTLSIRIEASQHINHLTPHRPWSRCVASKHDDGAPRRSMKRVTSANLGKSRWRVQSARPLAVYCLQVLSPFALLLLDSPVPPYVSSIHITSFGLSSSSSSASTLHPSLVWLRRWASEPGNRRTLRALPRSAVSYSYRHLRRRRRHIKGVCLYRLRHRVVLTPLRRLTRLQNLFFEGVQRPASWAVRVS